MLFSSALRRKPIIPEHARNRFFQIEMTNRQLNDHPTSTVGKERNAMHTPSIPSWQLYHQRFK